MMAILFQIFLIAFLINLLWEVIHSQLYETCLKSPLKKFIPLIIGASLKDGLFISLFYLTSAIIFGQINILADRSQLLAFIFLALSFSFIDEKISLKLGRWQYAKAMPKVFGVGLTPLLELAVTGVLTFLYVFAV